MKIIRFSQKGLVGYWRFDEETGSTAKDSSPYGNDGTIYGATRVRGTIGKALSFDGVDDYVEVPDSASLDMKGDEITITFWMKQNELDKDRFLVSKGGNYNAYQWRTYLNNHNKLVFCVYAGGSFNCVTGNTQLTDTQNFHHVAAVYDGSQMIIYLDGEVDNSKPKTGNFEPTTYNVYIGRRPAGTYFNGTIDEVRIYNRALSPGEIKIIYAFTKYIKPHPIIMRRKL